MSDNQMTLYQQVMSRLTPYEHEVTAKPLATVGFQEDGTVTMMSEGPIVVAQDLRNHPFNTDAPQVFCARCGKGPQFQTLTFRGKVYCAPCGEHEIALVNKYRDCRAYLPEYGEIHGQIEVKNTGIHWLREHGVYLGMESTVILGLKFPPPRGETYVAYIREVHRSAGMQDSNALIVDDPMDYNTWAGDYGRPPEAVVWYRVKKLLLVPFTNFPLF